ncbi:hypothetical protein [Taibaiella koreensis]|uniref:hypothetical protein n=1 Tax=Taibaiella koreensis TaxID=1268548 RepID=UPI000E59965E|nr:hypothetical protein [Taibaiella koreensis]
MTKLSAFFENREFFFTVNSQSDQLISITMYGGEYTLKKAAKGWENAEKNKNKMSEGLIRGVIAALQQEV